MKDAMVKYAAWMMAMGLAFGSSACVVFMDDEGEPPRCESSSIDEDDDGDRYANWGWHDDECSSHDWRDDDVNNEWGEWDNNADAGGDWSDGDDGDDGQGGTNGDDGGGQGGGTNGDDGGNDGDGGGGGGGTNGDDGGDDCPVDGKVCGEDGETYENACDASRAHVRVASEGPCLPPCSEDIDCADGSLCEAGSCHEVTCPDLAEDDYSQEVCADDGFTYQTACEARMARLSIAHEGCCVE